MANHANANPSTLRGKSSSTNSRCALRTLTDSNEQEEAAEIECVCTRPLYLIRDRRDNGCLDCVEAEQRETSKQVLVEQREVCGTAARSRATGRRLAARSQDCLP
jgi:hypothetical protein